MIVNSRDNFFVKQQKVVNQKLLEYKGKNCHLEKYDEVERWKIILFNDDTVKTINKWDYSIFETYKESSEDIPNESKLLLKRMS